MLGMSIGAIHSGMQAEIVIVEADISSGFPTFSIIGLPDSAITEAKLRIRSAFHNSRLPFPKGRITINLTPAHVRKRGSGLDFAMAIAILRAQGVLPNDASNEAFLGELGLSGNLASLESPTGLLLRLAKEGITRVHVSREQSMPPSLAHRVHLCAHATLTEAVEALTSHGTTCPPHFLTATTSRVADDDERAYTKLDKIGGRSMEKRLLSISAAGGHPLLLIGPPGIGKTTLAMNLVRLLPSLDDESALESYALHELVLGESAKFTYCPPCRTPHHSLTIAGMVGGGVPPRPGEVTLAHKGILLLDELFEFTRPTLNALREPLASRCVHLSRAGRVAVLPADFLLCATANPCPCGLRGYGDCRCLESDVRRYWARLSGPMLDRIELVFYMNQQPTNAPQETGQYTEEILKHKVAAAKELLRGQRGKNQADEFAMDAPATRHLNQLRKHIITTERSVHQVLSIAKTIAALDGRDVIHVTDFDESLQFRNDGGDST